MVTTDRAATGEGSRWFRLVAGSLGVAWPARVGVYRGVLASPAVLWWQSGLSTGSSATTAPREMGTRPHKGAGDGPRRGEVLRFWAQTAIGDGAGCSLRPIDVRFRNNRRVLARPVLKARRLDANDIGNALRRVVCGQSVSHPGARHTSGSQQSHGSLLLLFSQGMW